jgi:superfamily I DNA/RNA helicase
VERFDTRSDLEDTFIRRLKAVLERPFVRLGEVAVLAEQLRDVRRILALLERSEIQAVALSEWDGVDTDSVVVGTGKSAKGLEFKAVLLPYVESSLMRSAAPADDYLAEIWLMRKRELYVAMTRARDSLWAGYVA